MGHGAHAHRPLIFFSLHFPFAARQIPREFRCGISRSTRAVSSEHDASRTVAHAPRGESARDLISGGEAGPAPGSGAVGALAGHGSHTEGHRVAPGSGSARPVRATNQARGLLPDPHHTHSWSWSCRGAHVMASAADPSSSLGWQQHWQVEAWSPTKGTGAYMSERTESRRIWKATML
jgi:hypothetical protein